MINRDLLITYCVFIPENIHNPEVPKTTILTLKEHTVCWRNRTVENMGSLQEKEHKMKSRKGKAN